MSQRYVWNGETWVPAEAEASAQVGGHSCSSRCWPMTSKALAVHPSQVKQANARNRKHGVSVVYDQTGTAHIPDRGERRRLLRLEGMHDHHGGYGD